MCNILNRQNSGVVEEIRWHDHSDKLKYKSNSDKVLIPP